MNRLLQLTCAVLLSAICPATLRAVEPPEFDATVRPFLIAHCAGCHGAQKQKADLRVDTLATDFLDASVVDCWVEILDRINSGDMPPRPAPRPPADEAARVVEWIAAQLAEAERRQHAATGGTMAFHKLTREEHAHTIRDLLGVSVDCSGPACLPDDPDWNGFERIGSALSLSPMHVEKYLAAAETVLDEALSLRRRPERQVVRWTAWDIRQERVGQKKSDYEARGIADMMRVDLVPNNGGLDTKTIAIETAGDYSLRINASGLRAVGGLAPRLRLYAVGIDKVLFERDIEAPEDAPATIEVLVHLPAGEHLIRIVNAVPGPNPEGRRSRSSITPNAFTSLKSRVPWQLKFTDDDWQPIVPVLLLDSIEWDGPIVESWPTPAHQRIFFGGEQVAKDATYAREIVARFAARAWRRPVRDDEIPALMQPFELLQEHGEAFESAVKGSLVAVLCSTSFLYLEEGNAANPSTQLSDYELASRLSYFLWSSLPDQRLLDLAAASKLHEPETLLGEARRMLGDPRAGAIARSFPRQWLQLRKVGLFPPDKTLYPEYDDNLEQSMVAETIGFFGELLRNNGSLREFLDSDWTVLNERLATHYGIDGIRGDALRRVSLRPEQHRGGLLTQAAILSLTSDGTRHRPVHRGVWILESIIGKPPPPPPANVPALDTPRADAQKTTVRQKLELHRSDPNCAACHSKIDPLGIAFDNYDAIGRFRLAETLTDGAGDDPTLDPSGELPDGRKFADAQGLKDLLVADLDRFAQAVTEKLATYALRRGMTFADRDSLKQVAEQTKSHDYRLADLIEALVTSDLFRRR